MANKFNRREFIKIAGTGAGAAAVGGSLYKVFGQTDSPDQPKTGKIDKTATEPRWDSHLLCTLHNCSEL